MAELCRRLPTGATAGIGRMSRLLDCSHGALTQMPAQADLSGFDKHSQVRPVDAPEWGLPQSVPGLEDVRLYKIVDVCASLTASLAVVPHADPHTVEGVMRVCSDHRVVGPVQVWEAGELPGWLRRAAESTGDDEA